MSRSPSMRRFLLSLLMLIATVAVPAHAADGPGTATVRAANATLALLLKRHPAPGSAEEQKLAADVTAKLRGFLDVEELGRRALADHWAALGEGERKEFTQLLRGLVQASYVDALRAQLDYDVRYLSEKP